MKPNNNQVSGCWVTLREAAPRLRSSTQPTPTPKFIKVGENKGFRFLFRESDRRGI